MITPSFFTNPNIPGKGPVAETNRAASTRRGSAPADHLMYAWSMTANNNPDTARTTEHIEIRATHEECPPEVYLG